MKTELLRDEKKGVIISITIWVVLMIMVVGYFLDENNIIHIAGKYIAIMFAIVITLCVGLGSYSILKSHRDEDY